LGKMDAGERSPVLEAIVTKVFTPHMQRFSEKNALNILRGRQLTSKLGRLGRLLLQTRIQLGLFHKRNLSKPFSRE